MIYLYVNRAIGVLMLLVFIFFCCAIAAVKWHEVKQDFSQWKALRKAKKASTTQTRKGLHR